MMIVQGMLVLDAMVVIMANNPCEQPYATKIQPCL